MEDNVLINQIILERFVRFEKAKRLAHAYLFSGAAGIGKFVTAIAIAKLINCENRKSGDVEKFCDHCASCVKISNQSHPDIHILECAYGESIKIAQIRGIIDRTQLRPFEARKKVVIIRNAENFTIEAGNAFLKTLEEPSANSLIILTTSSPEKNLETIRSRCHSIYFPPLSYLDLQAQMQKRYRISGGDARFLSRFSEGSAGRAAELLDAGSVEEKNERIDYFTSRRADEAYLKSLAADKEKTKETLDVLLSWFRDLMLLKAGSPEEEVVHADRTDDLRSMLQGYSFSELKEITDEIVRATKLLNDNLNVKIALNLIKERISAGQGMY